MKIKKLIQKAVALLMAAVMTLSLMPTVAFAATGDSVTITFSNTYDSSGNLIRYNSGAVINGYNAGGTGTVKYRMYVNGSTAFCIQPGAPLRTGSILKESSSEVWNALSAGQKKAVGLALLYGYQGNRGNLSGTDDEKWVATQALVWEFVTGCRQSTGSFAQTDSTVYDLHFGSNYPNSGAAAAYDQILALLEQHNTVPSFMTGSTRELEYRDGVYTLTLTDTNGVLSDFDFSASDRTVTLSKSGNTLIISSAESLSGTVKITATRNNIPVVSESAKLIAYGDASLQDVVTGAENAEDVIAYLNVESYPVTVGKNGAVITVAMENTLIRGAVQLTKVDADYPDNKLTGAEFEIYRDSNGNRELDAEDEKLGTLLEVTTGVYEMSELTYGGYFVKETKAPDGFYLDENAYYFQITEHGKNVIVENEAGKGFVNQGKIGSLKIIKTSSDKKAEGFSFRVTGPNGYEQVFTTDKNGEILIENLRIGDYTISEVSDSASQNYVLPADKTASIFEGAVTKVEMHNELRDTPKTGDDSNPTLWLALMGVAPVGATACGVLAMKNKKKKGGR